MKEKPCRIFKGAGQNQKRTVLIRLQRVTGIPPFRMLQATANEIGTGKQYIHQR